MSIKPFQTPGFVAVNNSVFDLIMPALSANGFKVLCLAIRSTLGWGKTNDQISYSQFQERCGIASRSTVSKAIDECLEKGFLVRVEIPGSGGNLKNSFAYRLNVDLEIPSPENGLPSPENGLGSSTENGLGSSPKNGHTEIHKDKHQNDDDVLNILSDFGIDRTLAAKLAETTDLETVKSWIAYTQGRNLSNPQGFIVSRLQSGEKPPQIKSEDDTSRYTGGEFSDVVRS